MMNKVYKIQIKIYEYQYSNTFGETQKQNPLKDFNFKLYKFYI